MLKARNFPSWIDGYLKYAEISEAPELFHFWTAVSVIGGALRRKVWIDQRIFQWTPNFYIIFVAPPGIATKTTTIGIGHDILKEVEGVQFGPQSLTWQALVADMEKAKAIFEHPSSESGVYQMSALTISVGELGTFLKPKDTELIDNLTSMWDGQIGTHKHSTKTTGSNTVVNPWINIIGCTTPSWMRNNFPAYMIEGGLTSRTIFLHADQKRQLVSYPGRMKAPQAYRELRARLVEDLQTIGELCGPMEISEAGYEWGDAWYKRHWTGRPVALLSDRFSGYLARKQTHIHKLAMIFAISRGNQLLVTAEDLMKAERIITSLETDIKRVFDAIGLTDTGKASAEILSLMRVYKHMTKKDIYKTLIARIDQKEIDAALVSLEQIGTVRKGFISDDNGGMPLPGFELTSDELTEVVQSLGYSDLTSSATPR